MNLKCQLLEKTSKTGKKYLCLEVVLTENYKKLIFLDDAELELLRIVNAK